MISSDKLRDGAQVGKVGNQSFELMRQNIAQVKSGLSRGDRAPSFSDTLKLTTPFMQGETVKALQYNLSDLSFAAHADGTFGPSTEAAVKAFQQSHGLTADGVAGQITLTKIREVKRQAVTSSAMPAHMMDSGMVSDWAGGDKLAAVEAIKREARRQKISERSHIAYILATVDHETNGSFQPVEEGYYLGANAEAHRQTLDYYPYYGRGYVQITWAENYHKYSKLTGLDLLNQPEWMLRPDVSLFVLIDGMKRGVFTGRRLDDFTTGSRFDFVEARRIINGKDRAEEIASLADSWLSGTA